jgi:hypothetical protein
VTYSIGSSKGLFTKSEFKLSKSYHQFSIKKDGINNPLSDTFTITNNWPVKATYSFQNHYNISAEALISVYPPTGEIEKVRF